MPTLRLGATVNLWSAETFSGLTAGDYSAVAEFLPGQARGFLVFELVFSAAPTAVSLDIEHAEAGVIYRRLVNFTKAIESFSCAATPGKYRVKVVTQTAAAAETLTLTVTAQTEAPAVADNIEINEASGDAAGAVLRMGLSGFPLRKDTANTDFIYGNFVNDAITGTTRGLNIVLDVGGALLTYAECIKAQLNITGASNTRNPVGVQADLNFSSTGWVQGLGYGLGTYITFPNTTVTTGTFTGINIEFSIPTSWVGHLNNLKHSMLRFAVGGDGIAQFQDDGYLMELSGFAEGTGNIFSAGSDQAAEASLRILIDGVKYYIMLSTTELT